MMRATYESMYVTENMDPKANPWGTFSSNVDPYSKSTSFTQRFGREKDENRAVLCLLSNVFSFESGRLRCSILVIKISVRF